MKQFSQNVDMRSRSAMVRFLSGHARYFTMNSWNRSTSYANCVKIHTLDLTPAQMDQAWKLLDCEEVFDAIHGIIREWSASHDWRLQAGFNGRSGGYVVLYQGGLDYKNAHTARCDVCGKRTWHKQDTPCTNDWCAGTLRVQANPIPQIVCYPGRGLDEDAVFADWGMGALRERVRLVQDFDRLCDRIAEAFLSFCNDYEVVDEEILVPKTVKVLKVA